MELNTVQLLNKLSQTENIKEFLKEYEPEFLSLSLRDFLNDTLAHKNLTVAEVSKNSGQGEYVYKVFSGERKPSRDVLIGIAFGLKLSFNETQLLLRIAKTAVLDVRDKWDSAVIYALNEGKNFLQLNDLLFELNLRVL